MSASSERDHVRFSADGCAIVRVEGVDLPYDAAVAKVAIAFGDLRDARAYVDALVRDRVYLDADPRRSAQD